MSAADAKALMSVSNIAEHGQCSTAFIHATLSGKNGDCLTAISARISQNLYESDVILEDMSDASQHSCLTPGKSKACAYVTKSMSCLQNHTILLQPCHEKKHL